MGGANADLPHLVSWCELPTLTRVVVAGVDEVVGGALEPVAEDVWKPTGEILNASWAVGRKVKPFPQPLPPIAALDIVLGGALAVRWASTRAAPAGAFNRTPAEHPTYANDLNDEHALIVVPARSTFTDGRALLVQRRGTAHPAR
ncbi:MULTISPECIES: hypothetical protein [unclassified Streptomyces]|uniref:hypothetical protein n=1 Tax=unclassified Streptomyces TaxID=2593676 RepID=UPI0036E5CAB4